MVALFFIGRIIFGGYFIYNAYNHFKNAGHLAGYAGMKGVPAPKAGVITSGVLFLLGGLSIVLGTHMVLGMWFLIIALIPITFMMHGFWKEKETMARMNERIGFLKNLALIGALLIMISMAYIYFS
jgi:uncharacterized membrane protein YphA (DoxX/SURF4 family)